MNEHNSEACAVCSPEKNRRRLTAEELADIKEQLLESIYADIGKSLVKKILWLVGTVVATALAGLTALGHIKWGN